jgi:hypothetical protein
MNIFLTDKKLIKDIAECVYLFGGKQGYKCARRILKMVNESATVIGKNPKRTQTKIKLDDPQWDNEGYGCH